jgi:hypothetical protein
VQSLVHNLTHRHSAVRLAVLKAMDALVLAGAADSVVVDVVVPAMRPLVTVRAPPCSLRCRSSQSLRGGRSIR